MSLRNVFLVGFVLCGATLAAEISKNDDRQGPEEEMGDAAGRVVGGTNARDGAFPYHVSIQRINRDNFPICGGAIIADRWILTAAHCFKGISANELSILAGTNHKKSGGRRYKIDKIVRHEKFTSNPLVNDIALLRTKGNIKFTEKVKAIEVAKEDPKPGDKCKLSGWGFTNKYKNVKYRPSPNLLQWLEVKIISEKDCKTTYLKSYEKNFPITANHICTLNKDGEGFCQGDGGGTLECNNKSSGIISWNIPCAQGHPDVYTRTSKYSTWIQKNMEANKP
ncbi:chymotrypsin-2-like [Pieris napi]|uniref:chymotrypsin-2-like n=1 Tax=Pieris napi TaxID=78633 RepID=UPI001FBBCCC5|nr:chymotrypsin-2-like [Pieris napi]